MEASWLYRESLSPGHWHGTGFLDSLLKKLEELNRAAKAPGGSCAQLEAQVKQITLAVKEAINDLGKSLPPELAGASGMLVDVFKAQLGPSSSRVGWSFRRARR